MNAVKKPRVGLTLFVIKPQAKWFMSDAPMTLPEEKVNTDTDDILRVSMILKEHILRMIMPHSTG